jgi:hypothetical protein
MATKRTKGGPAGPPNTSAIALRYVLPSVEDLALPNVEGMSPRAAFNAFMDHAKRILHPSVLHDLVRSKLHDLGTKEPELSIIDIRDRMRELCTEEEQLLRGKLHDLGNEVERYVGNNAAHALIAERLGWMIGQVEAWEPERFHGDNAMDMPQDLRSAVAMERVRYSERWKGFSEVEREAEVMLSRHLLGYMVNATKLRVEFGQRLEEIAAALNSGRVAAAPERPTARITWNDNASLLAYLLTELIEADYIIPPPNGRRIGRNGNRAAVADMVYQLMDIRDRDTGRPVSREFFRSLLRPKSPDRNSFPDLFRIRSRVSRNRPT